MIFAMPITSVLFATAISATAETQPIPNPGHPRLYFSARDLPRLRQLRRHGLHKKIWQNVQDSADWCLTRTPRKEWIAPISPDPIYENLYDRFYAIMGDLAITEHLAFAYALSGDPRYGEAARQWVLASCRAWQSEADGEPDGSKAYAVARLLKGVAVGYDIAYDRFTDAERQQVREVLVRIGQKYHQGYFSTPTIAGPGFHTHHAVVEWASFGVAALVLLDEVPEARSWLEATIRKFEDHLLPTGLAADGAQTEGGTFWASTMQYRLFFMDALRRVTGHDLFHPFEKQMNADLALASVASEKNAGYDPDHANVVLEPYYGQLDYYSPVLLCLAREYRRPIYQYLALWDHSLGHIQKTRAITPHGEQLLIELGGYAYLWYDPSVPAQPDEKRLSRHFPSVNEAYARTSWKPNDLLVGVRKGEVVVHAGGQAVLVEPIVWRDPPADLPVQSLKDDGAVAVIECDNGDGKSMTIELRRPERKLILHRRSSGEWQWWCHTQPTRTGNLLTWSNQVRLNVLTGDISSLESSGYEPALSTGYGKLLLADPAPMKFPRVTVRPSAKGEVVVEVRY